MMHAKLLSAGLALAVSAASAGSWIGARAAAAPPGPYRVVISKPIVSPGHTVGTLYGEHEYLTAMLNQLDKEGLRPVRSELMARGAVSGTEEIRLLMVCVDK